MIALFSFLGFCVGIIVFYFGTPAPLSLLFCILFLACVCAYVLFQKKSYAALAAFFIFCALAGARFIFVPAELPDSFSYLIDSRVELSGTIVSDPDVRESHQRIIVLVHKEKESTKVLVTSDPYPSLHIGDIISVSGVLKKPEAFKTDGDRVFHYDSFLAKENIFSMISYAHIEKTGVSDDWILQTMRALASVKHSFEHGLRNALTEPSASLADGMLLGGKQGLGESILNAFIITGLVHIVVLSGYNVAIVARAVESLFRALTFSKHITLIFAGATIFLFVCMAGAGPASIRAGIMASVALFAQISKRTYDALRALMFAGFVMLLFNPRILVDDPGFQLSFIATLGLILGSPIIEKKIIFIRSVFLREITATTIAAQIAVLPLLLYQTGLLSFVSLPANIAVLPLVPLAMFLSFIAGVGGMLFNSVAPLIGFPAYLVLEGIISFALWSATLPFASITIPPFSFLVVIVAYVLLGFLVFIEREKKLPPS